jgi:hypothetical protein
MSKVAASKPKKQPLDGDLESDRLHFDKEKWREDRSFRERELEFKREELNRSRWINPLVIAILAAAVAALGNAGVTLVGSRQQFALESEKAKSLLYQNREQAEAARILEVVKTNNPDQAATNFKFLVDIGLINDGDTRKKIETYVEIQRKNPGKGAALPVVAAITPFTTNTDFYVTCSDSKAIDPDRLEQVVVEILRQSPFYLDTWRKVSNGGYLASKQVGRSDLLPGFFERTNVRLQLIDRGVVGTVDNWISRLNSPDPSAYREMSTDQTAKHFALFKGRLAERLASALGVPCEAR